MNLEHFVVLESKKVIKQERDISQRHKNILKRTHNHQSWNNMSNKINNGKLDYNPQYKINIQEPILI